MLFRKSTNTSSTAVFYGMSAGGLLLAAATFLVWQCRFERVGAPRNPSFLEGGAGWDVVGEGVAFDKAADGSTTVRLTRSPDRPVPVISQRLDAEAQRYVWIRCEHAARGLQPGRELWEVGRVVCYGVDEAGRGMFNHEHAAAGAKNNQTWRKSELVFELDPGMKQVVVALQNYGRGGEFAVRNFDVAYVRDRAALYWLVPLLLLGWGSWLVAILRRGLAAQAPVWRCALGAVLPLALFWILALPGINTIARPLAAQAFRVPQAAAAPLSLAAAARPAAGPAGVTPRSTNSPAGSNVGATSAPAASSTLTAPIPRHRPVLAWVSRKWDVLHAVVFFGLTFALLILTGTRLVWRISAVMVVLIQGVEWLQYGFLEVDDAVETVAAAAGILFALYLWRRLRPRSSLPVTQT